MEILIDIVFISAYAYRVMALSRFSADVSKAVDRRLRICHGTENFLLQEAKISVLATWRSNEHVP